MRARAWILVVAVVLAACGPSGAPAPLADPATTRPNPVATARPVATTKPQPATVYYANCTEARAAGAAPMRRGESGYRAGLDRDSDGVACE